MSSKREKGEEEEEATDALSESQDDLKPTKKKGRQEGKIFLFLLEPRFVAFYGLSGYGWLVDPGKSADLWCGARHFARLREGRAAFFCGPAEKKYQR